MMRHADSHSDLTGRAVTLWIRAMGLMLMLVLLAWPVGSAWADDEEPGSAPPAEKSDDNGEADDSEATDDEEPAEAEDTEDEAGGDSADDEAGGDSAKKKLGRRISPTNRSSQRPGKRLQPGRSSHQREPQRRRGRDTDDSTTESEEGATIDVDWESTFSFSNFQSPPEERTYVFAFDEVDYASVMNQWARMTGLPVLGDPPSGKVTYASAETLDYKTALGRINQLLFNHEKIYWMLRTEDNVFLVMLMSDVPRYLPVDRIMPSLEAFEAAQLDDEEVAMLLYTPPSGSVDDLQAIRDFMPDYMRTAPYQNSNSMTIFGKVIDIRKYLQLNDLFSSAGDDPRTPLQIPVRYITATKAVELLEQMMDSGRRRSGTKLLRSPRGGKGSDPMLSSGPTPALLIPFNEQKLILAKAIQKQIDEIYRLLELIDLPKLGEFNPIVIPLEHARADELVSIIYPLASGGKAKKTPRTKGKASGSETGSPTGLNIVPEPRTNSLIVIGADEEQIANVYTLVDMFDVPETETYRIIDVVHVDAEELIETANNLMGGRAGKGKGSPKGGLVMRPTPTGGSIIMKGERQLLDQAEQIIASLDIPSTEEEPTLHQAQLFNAKPSVVAEMLTGLDELEDGDRSSGKPKAAPKKGALKRRSRSAGERFFSDDASKTLFVMCTDQEWETKYHPRIQEFDHQAVPDTTLIEVTYITPEEALTTLQQLFPPVRAAGKGKPPGGSHDVQFALTVGGLIVANATPSQIDKMRDVVAQIDVDPLADVTVTTRIFHIQHADPSEVRALVETLVTEASAGKPPLKGRQPRRNRNKQSDGSTIAGQAPMRIAMVGNRMVVSADAEVMAEIEELIASVDLPDPENELRVYTFGSGTNVNSLSQELSNLFPNGTPRRRGGGGAKGQAAGASASVIRFIPQHVGRKLVVSAPPELFPEIEQAIEKLSPISDEVPLEWRVFTLEYADAAEVVALVEPILSAKMSELYETGELGGVADGAAGKKQRRGRQDGKLTIMPDATGGRIVVLAPSILMPEAEVLIKAFDVEAAVEDMVIRIVRVTNTDAEEMGVIIRAMITGQAPLPKPKRPRRGEEKGRPRGIEIGGPMKVMVAAAPGGRSLVLSGDPRDVEEVESWIHELDGEAESTGTFKVYQVTYSDPWELAETIMAFVDSGQGRGGKGAERPKNQDSLLGGIFDGFMPPSGPMIGREVTINVDSGSGTLVVQASPSKLRMVDELMELYEGKDGAPPMIDLERESIPTLLYDLQYADAFDAVWTLQDYLGVLWNHPDPLPIVEEIPFTDTLVIKTNPKYFDEVKALIAEHIDKEGAAQSPTRVEWRIIDGAIASEVAKKLSEQLIGIDVDLEVAGMDMNILDKLIPVVGPFVPEDDSIDEDASCVLPLCVTSAWNGLVSAASGQTAADEDADSEPTEEEIRQMLLQGSADGSSQASEESEPAGDESDLLTGDEDDADGESDEPEVKPKVRIYVNNITGALVVEGPDDVVQEVMYTLDAIMDEIEEQPQRPVIRVYRLRYVDVDWATQVLEAMFNLKKASSKSSSAAIQQQIKQIQTKLKASSTQRGGKAPDPKAAAADQKKLEELQGKLAVASAPSNIHVYPIPRNQSLAIRAKPADFPAIVELLATVDRPGETTYDFKIFELLNRRAAEVEQMVKLLLGLDKPVSKSRAPTSGKPNPQQQQIQQLQDQLSQLQGSGSEGLPARPDQIKITSDALTNSIHVHAPRPVIPMIEDLIYQIENQPMPERVIETYALANADATEVVGHLKELFPGAGQTRRAPKKAGAGSTGFDPGTVNAPVFMAVTRTNTVFVQALDIDIPKIAAEIDRLDMLTEGDAVVAVKIRWGNPDSIARTLQQMFENRAGGGRKGGPRGGSGLKIIGDSDSNTVFIRGASPGLLDEIQAQIIAMDTREGTQPRSIKIAEGTPTEIAQIVEAVYGGGRGGPRGRPRGSAGSVKVTGDDASKQLFVIAPDELFADIVELVNSLDVPSGFEHKLFNLEYMKASDAVKQLDQIVRPLVGGSGRGRGPRGSYAAVADDRTQTIVAMGSPEILEQVTGLLEKLDVEEALVAQIQSAFFALTRARANEMARNINNLFKTRGRNEGQDPPRVEANQSTNSLIVLGTEDQINQIREMIEKVESETTETPLKNEVFTLVDAKADEAAEMLKTFFQDRQRAYKQAGVQIPPAEVAVSITADVATNQVLVLASESNMKLVHDRIEELEQPGVGGKIAVVTRVYPIQYADPNGVVQAINGMNPRGRGRQAPKDRIAANVEWQTSSVIVTASGENQERIAELIAEMDADRGGSVREIYKMVNGRASDVAAIANQIIGGGRRTRQRGQQTTVVANDSLNTLVVSGMRSKVDNIVELIKSLDLPPDATAGRKPQVYQLKFADPNSMINVLRNSFPRVRGTPPDDYVDAAFAWGTGALVVTASQDNHAKVATLLEQIDIEAGGRQTHVIKLKHANSDDLASRLAQVFGRSTRRERHEVPMSILSDPGTNSLIVFANDKELANVQALLEKIDVPQDAETGLFVEVYRVNFANPNSLIATINNVFRTPRRSSPQDEVRSSYDWGTNTLVVSASKANHEKLAELLAAVDVENEVEVREIYHMNEARASDVAGVVNQSIRANLQRSRQQGQQLSVVANDTLNMIVIAGTRKDVDRTVTLVKQLDLPPDETAGRHPEVYTLKYADPGSTIAALRGAFPRTRGTPPDAFVDASYTWGTGALVVTASQDNHEQIKELLGKIDVETGGRQTHVIKLVHANSDDLASRLSQIFGRSTRRAREEVPMSISSDPGTNSLIVFANDKELANIQTLLEKIDVPQDAETGLIVEVYRVRYADPGSLINTIATTFRTTRRGSPMDEVRASYDWGTSTLVISASKEKHERIAALIGEVDTEGINQRRTHIIKLKEANAEEIARGFQQFLRATQRNIRGGEIPMQVYANPGTNSLVIYATDEELAEIQSMLLVVDVKPDWMTDRQIKSFKLTYADAWGLRGMILEMFRGGRNVSPADQVTSMADRGSNALVVSASRNNMEQIEKLIAEVDKKDASQREVHVVQADHADSVARALAEAFGARGRQGQQTITITNPPGTDSLLIRANDQEFEEIMAALTDLESLGEQIGGDVRVIRLEKSEAQELQSVVQEILRQPGQGGRRGGELAGDVRVSVIPSANALIISGETDDLDRIEPMIRDLDVQTVGSEAQIIRLIHVDPSRIEPILTRMYGDSRSRGSRGRGEDVPVIVADDMSMTLLVYASPMDFNKIETLVAKLDTPDTNIASGIKIIPVQAGINVSDLAATLDSLLAESSRYEAEALGTTRKQVAITADVRTNTIIAAGAPSRFAEIEELVRSLELMGPRGGEKTIILKTKNISADDIKRLIEQMSDESSSSSSRSRRRR